MTIPLDSHFIPAFSIEDVILDKDTGAPLSGGKVYFEEDNQRGTLKPVWQITGTSPNYSFTQLPNPMTLSSIGTFEDSLGNPVIPYFYPYDANGVDLYYIRVESSEGVEQFTREAQPFIADTGSTVLSSAFVNELSNPQFAVVTFDSSTSKTFSFNAVSNEVVNIAPDWDIVVTSPAAGSVTLEVLTPTGALNISSNPGTILDITSAGLTSFKLRQRIYGSSNLWGSGNLAATFLAKTFEGTDSTLTLSYSQSNGSLSSSPVILVTATLQNDGLYRMYPGTAAIGASNSSEFFPDAYVDITFDIPTSEHIAISSVMVVATGDAEVDSLNYDQESYARQVDHLFHYYKNELVTKPKASILTGWNFSLNPFQFNDTTLTTASSQTQYIADQTIIHQLAGSTVKTGQSGVRNTLQVQAINGVTDNRFALIQYIPPQTIMPYWSYLLSSLARMRIFTSHGTEVGIKMRLIWRTELPPTLSNTEPVASWASTDPVFASGWTSIAPLNDPAYILPNSYDTTEGTNAFPAFSYDAFQMPDWDSMSADTMTLGIVVYTTANMNDTLGTEDSIEFDRISLVPNAFAVDSPPQTFDEVLRDCQFFYEKSYLNTVLPGTASDEGSLISRQLVIPAATTGGLPTAVSLIARVFELQFNTLKRTSSPEVHLYSPTALAAIDTVAGLIRNGAATAASSALATTNWTQSVLSNKSVNFLNANTTALITTAPLAQDYQDAYIQYHYTVDARLGLVP